MFVLREYNIINIIYSVTNVGIVMVNLINFATEHESILKRLVLKNRSGSNARSGSSFNFRCLDCYSILSEMNFKSTV